MNKISCIRLPILEGETEDFIEEKELLNNKLIWRKNITRKSGSGSDFFSGKGWGKLFQEPARD